MQDTKISLPIDPYVKDILDRIQKFSTTLIKASPGSGKTTRLPWSVANLATKKVIVLEPRRLAAKLAAERIAYEENLKLGHEVGYHFRFDKNISDDTKLIFYTEGTFLKMLKSDPQLSDVEVVILDEFHERHLETDLALAYLRGIQTQREDLKIVLMSATLDENLVSVFKNANVLSIETPHFPVEISYLPNQPSVLNQVLELKIKNTLDQIPLDFDVLVFLPGMREILKVKNYLDNKYGNVLILHSEISKDEQELALGECSERKIILATNIAESSITIPGVRAVIDSGIQREASYSPWNGLKTVEDHPTTKASAIQRAGRAGRTAPGRAYRLYSKQDFENRDEFQIAEIFKSDLTDSYLLTRELGENLIWPTEPPQDRWIKAKTTSFLIGFTHEDGTLTSIVEKSDQYPLDKKLARVLIEGEKTSIEERKKLVHFICEVLEKDSSGKLKNRLHFYLKGSGSNQMAWEQCLLAGFIDQVSKYRKKQNDFIHFSGKIIKPHHSINDLVDGYYLILDITQRQEAMIAIPIEEQWLFEHDPFPFTEEQVVQVIPTFSLKSMSKLGSILIDEKNSLIKLAEINDSLKHQIIKLADYPFQKKWLEWQENEAFNRYHLWLKVNKKEEDLKNPDFWSYVEYNRELNWDGVENYFKELTHFFELEEILPTELNLGSKRKLKICYPFNQTPYIEAPIQDFYGLKETPKIYENKISLALRLIGPHKRPLQVTSNLAGFWHKTYPEIVKELKRDYPRHFWPDEPSTAKPFLLKRHAEN